MFSRDTANFTGRLAQGRVLGDLEQAYWAISRPNGKQRHSPTGYPHVQRLVVIPELSLISLPSNLTWSAAKTFLLWGDGYCSCESEVRS